ARERFVEGEPIGRLVGVAQLIERRQRILDGRRLHRQRARLQPLADQDPHHADQTGRHRAAEEEKQYMPPIERQLHFVLPTIEIAHGGRPPSTSITPSLLDRRKFSARARAQRTMKKRSTPCDAEINLRSCPRNPTAVVCLPSSTTYTVWR